MKSAAGLTGSAAAPEMRVSSSVTSVVAAATAAAGATGSAAGTVAGAGKGHASRCYAVGDTGRLAASCITRSRSDCSTA